LHLYFKNSNGIIQEVKDLRTYQTVAVIDSLLKSEEIDAIIEKILRIINNNGGTVKNVDRWEKKRLAFQIKKRQYGYYVEIIFEAPGDLVKILDRDYRLDENILRYLTITLGKKALAIMEKQKASEEPPLEEELPELEDITDDMDEEDEDELVSFEQSELSSS
jgi:small subunit ribosomal protein S6